MNFRTIGIILGILLIIFLYPRMLVYLLGIDSPWVSYLYMYGMGFIFFLIGIWLILKTKACQWGRGYDTKWFLVLVFGFIFVFSMHGLWILLSIYIPVKGG